MATFDVSSPPPSGRPPRSFLLLIATALTWPALQPAAQSVTINVVANAIHVRAPALSFIKDDALARLKDGQSVRVDVGLTVHAKLGTAPIAESRQSCVLSYDLWEERFAAVLAEVPSRAISHVSSPAAEAWCVDQLSVPASAIGSARDNMPFWIRLEYRMFGAAAAAPGDNTGFTLKTLIDALSRRRTADDLTHAIEAGPFRLP